MSNATNVKRKKTWMYMNDALSKYCKFYTGHSVGHTIESIQIFIKTTLFITYCQSETRNKTWMPIILNFFCKLFSSIMCW